jgi:hypothetical protein
VAHDPALPGSIHEAKPLLKRVSLIGFEAVSLPLEPTAFVLYNAQVHKTRRQVSKS